MPHRGRRLWLREDPALPRPTGERARVACRDKSNADPVLFWDGDSIKYRYPPNAPTQRAQRPSASCFTFQQRSHFSPSAKAIPTDSVSDTVTVT